MSQNKTPNKFNMNVEDSASAASPGVTGKGKAKAYPKKGTGPGKSSPNSSGIASRSVKAPLGFAEGTKVLEAHGLSVSGVKERILTPFKADKFFHFVEQAWVQLAQLKPQICERFSLEEFRHCSALMLYHRIESVKFETLGIKPSAPVRIPLPKNLRVFQPLWSVLANIGTVDDDDLRVVYVPDGILPESDDLTTDNDIEALLTCTLYDWMTSWNNVRTARANRSNFSERDGYISAIVEEPSSSRSKETLMSEIQRYRRILAQAQKDELSGNFKQLNGSLYAYENVKDKPKEEITDDDLRKTTRYWSSSSASAKLQTLFDEAKLQKDRRIQPKFDKSYSVESYSVSDGTITAEPGAYGTRLHWDPALWLGYEQFVEMVTPMALFSLSMPAETNGTYAWVLPVEKRDENDSSVFCKMPKASIAPATWILALLLQSSTLPFAQRSTFYVETDRLTNVLGLRVRYIRAAIKDPTAVETYGTY